MPLSKTSASTRAVVGVDIEPGSITAVQVRPGAPLCIERAVTVPLAPTVVRDGEVNDVEGLAQALRELWQEHRLPKRVRLGVANQRIVVRTIDLPPLGDTTELDAIIRFQAQDHIPMPLEQAVLEHQSLGIVETPDGPRARVVLVAARRSMIEGFLTAARSAGLRPAGIDLSAFAMIRAIDEPAPEGTAVLYLAVGGMTNLAVANGRECLFTRVVPGGTERMTQELAERRGLTHEHARGWLMHVGAQSDVARLDGDPEIIAEARTVLTDGIRRVSDEIRSSLDFYRTQVAALPVERAVLIGSAAEIPGLAEELGTQIGLGVVVASVASAASDAGDGPSGGRLAVAAGLAIEEAR